MAAAELVVYASAAMLSPEKTFIFMRQLFSVAEALMATVYLKLGIGDTTELIVTVPATDLASLTILVVQVMDSDSVAASDLKTCVVG